MIFNIDHLVALLYVIAEQQIKISQLQQQLAERSEGLQNNDSLS